MSISLAEVKQSISEGTIKKLSGLSLLVAKYLNDEESLEEIVASLSDSDLSEDELKILFGRETEALISKIAIEQADFNLAAWILQQPESSDFVKEEIAYAFTNEFSLNQDEDGLLTLELYSQGFLTDKEKQQVLKKASQRILLNLALNAPEEDLLVFLKLLDSLHLSLFLQDSKVRLISSPVKEFLEQENKLIGKNALAVLTKSYNLTNNEKNKLVDKALAVDDIEIAYFLLTQVEIEDRKTLDKIISLGLKSFYFTWGSIPLRNMQEVEEFIILNHVYQIEENGNERKMVFQNKVLAKKNKEEFIYNKYFSAEVGAIIRQQLTRKQTTLPKVIKGKYNFQLDQFVPHDSSLDVSQLEINEFVYESESFVSSALKLWKPNIPVDAILEFKNKKSVLTILNQAQQIVDPWQAENLAVLRKRIQQRIQVLSESLNLAPMNPSRAFGVEIELCMSGVRPSDLALTIEAQDLYETNSLPEVNSSRKSAISSWAIKSDDSVKHVDKNNRVLKEMDHLSTNRFTAEIITPKLYGEEGLEEIRQKLNTLLQEYDNHLSVNFTCGLHVHHDMNHLFELNKKTNQYEIPSELEQMIKEELAKIQESLYSLCAPHRRNNMYCPRFEVTSKVKNPTLKSTSDTEENIPRPRPGFNLGTGYGTLEYRMHEGTLDVEQIINWVKITHHLFDQIVHKVLVMKNQAVGQLEETLKLMEIEKLKKIQNEQDLDVALREINEFINNNAWAKILIHT